MKNFINSHNLTVIKRESMAKVKGQTNIEICPMHRHMTLLLAHLNNRLQYGFLPQTSC